MATAYALKTAVINFSTSGDNTVIAAVAGAPIKVFGLSLTVAGATNLTMKDGASTNLSGAFVLTGNGSSINFQPNQGPMYYCVPGDAFVINSSQAVSVQGTVWYMQGG